jgi:hypothetical protein
MSDKPLSMPVVYPPPGSFRSGYDNCQVAWKSMGQSCNMVHPTVSCRCGWLAEWRAFPLIRSCRAAVDY